MFYVSIAWVRVNKSKAVRCYLWKAICVRANNGDVAFARGPAMLGRVLLYVKQKRLVLRDCCCAGVFPYVRCLDCVLANVKG